jgi:hypothetical protein
MMANCDAKNEWPVLGERSSSLPQRLILPAVADKQACARAMIKQGRRFLRIFSQDLDPSLYSNRALVDAISHLARYSRFSDIRLLIQDSSKLIKQEHQLMDLARRLPSRISIRIYKQRPDDIPEDVMLVDDAGVIVCGDKVEEPGFACFDDRPFVARLTQRFDDLWEQSYADPQLRKLSL